MVKSNIYEPTACRRVVEQVGCFSLLEYERTIPLLKEEAAKEYFASKMNIRKRQVAAELNGNGIIVQAGAMQWVGGNIEVQTNVKGAGDFAKKLIGAKVTGESAIKPLYRGTGTIVLEPTYKHILFVDVSTWGSGGIVIEDSLFYACDETVSTKVIARSTFSSAALGGEGLFNNCLSGKGIAVLEIPVPSTELIEIELTEPNDVVKIDGNMAIAWSSTLTFTVERTTKTLIGSAASGEGLVNVYRGQGKILMAPLEKK